MIYYICEALDQKIGERQIREGLRRMAQADSRLINHKINLQKVQLLQYVEKFQLLGDVLYYTGPDKQTGELRYRCCAPKGTLRAIEVPTGSAPLQFRNELFLAYHNSKTQGHRGRDLTLKLLQDDWFWVGMADDAQKWCRQCQRCQEEWKGSPHQAWTRNAVLRIYAWGAYN